LLDPVFENRLVFWLCNTRITPNQVTVFTGILGAYCLLFLHGWLRLGITLAYVVKCSTALTANWLGQKLQTSRLGELRACPRFFHGTGVVSYHNELSCHQYE
jgi:hypothetical protein